MCVSYRKGTLNFILKAHWISTEMLADESGNQRVTGNSLILMSRAREAVINHTTCRWQLAFLPTGYVNWAGPSIPNSVSKH